MEPPYKGKYLHVFWVFRANLGSPLKESVFSGFKCSELIKQKFKNIYFFIFSLKTQYQPYFRLHSSRNSGICLYTSAQNLNQVNQACFKIHSPHNHKNMEPDDLRRPLCSAAVFFKFIASHIQNTERTALSANTKTSLAAQPERLSSCMCTKCKSRPSLSPARKKGFPLTNTGTL